MAMNACLRSRFNDQDFSDTDQKIVAEPRQKLPIPSRVRKTWASYASKAIAGQSWGPVCRNCGQRRLKFDPNAIEQAPPALAKTDLPTN